MTYKLDARYFRSLRKICSNYAPSRVISFNIVYVFNMLQLIKRRGHVSRDLLSKELGKAPLKPLATNRYRLLSF